MKPSANKAQPAAAKAQPAARQAVAAAASAQPAAAAEGGSGADEGEDLEEMRKRLQALRGWQAYGYAYFNVDVASSCTHAQLLFSVQ